MKAKHVIVYLLLAIVSSSCIREEALNAEADILSCILPGVAMTTSPIINNNSITIFVGPGTDISELKQNEISIPHRNILSQLPTVFGKKHIQYQ